MAHCKNIMISDIWLYVIMYNLRIEIIFYIWELTFNWWREWINVKLGLVSIWLNYFTNKIVCKLY